MSNIVLYFLLFISLCLSLYLTYKIYQSYRQTLDSFLLFGLISSILFIINIILWNINYDYYNNIYFNLAYSVLFIAAYASIFWAFFDKAKVRFNSTIDLLEFIIDTIIVITVSFSVAIYTTIKPIAPNITSLDTSSSVVLIYPILGVMVLFAIIMIWSHEQTVGRNKTFYATTLGLLTLVISATLFGHQIINQTYIIGSYIDLLFLVAITIIAYAFFTYKPSNYCAINIGFTIPAIRKTIVPYMLIGVWLILYIYAKLHGTNEIWDIILYDTGVALIFFTILKQLVMLYRNRQLLLKLEKLSSTDALTGAYNRHFLDQYSIKFREQHDKTTVSMLFIDLVRFKNFNDKYGHLAGDERLKAVVYLIESIISIEHYTIRYGGDEFLILLPDTDETKANKIENIINKELELYNQKNTSIEPLELTIGVFTSDNLDLLKMIDEADREMYKSKGITQLEYTP